jgi:hypothetical protein
MLEKNWPFSQCIGRQFANEAKRFKGIVSRHFVVCFLVSLYVFWCHWMDPLHPTHQEGVYLFFKNLGFVLNFSIFASRRSELTQ